jgi:zinc protease
VEMDDAHKEVLRLLDDFKSGTPPKYDLDKVRNKLEATRQYTHTNNLQKAMDLAFYELLGDAGNINLETGKYRRVTIRSIQKAALTLFDPDNSSTLFYYAGK